MLAVPFARLLYVLAFCLLAAGCKGDGNAKVIGNVNYDGKPIEKGIISFAEQTGSTPSAEAIITQGKYQVDVPPGKKLVKITASKVVSSRPAYEGAANSPMIEITEQYLPAIYNEQSTLTREITTSGPQDFELKSSP